MSESPKAGIRPVADQALEARIQHAHGRLARASPGYQRQWWGLMVRLIRRRSPTQIHRMERERALR